LQSCCARQGNLAPVKRQPYSKRKIDPERLRKLVAEHPDWMQSEYARELNVAQSSICVELQRQKLTRKKITKRYCQRDEAKRQRFAKRIASKDINKLAFLDESLACSNLHYEFGYAPQGEKLLGDVSGDRSIRIGLVGALRGKEPFAMHQFEGTMNRERLLKYLAEVLIPQMRPGEILVMDNASYHRHSSVRRLLNRHGIGCWYLPKYSPDFNPIENYWSWLKREIKKWRRIVKDFRTCLWIARHTPYAQS
jgi:transposase